MNRTEILKKAQDCVTGVRQIEYGEPEDNFAVIARLWSAYLENIVTEADVAAMMVLFKVARLATGAGSEDSWVDIAGYAACGGEIATKGDSHGESEEQ